MYLPREQDVLYPLYGDIGVPEDMKPIRKELILWHEVAHYIQDVAMIHSELNLDIKTRQIIWESHADYFSGWLLGSHLWEWSLTSEIQAYVKSYFEYWARLPDDYSAQDVPQDSFVLINWDEHGTPEHRMTMFMDGFENGDYQRFMSPILFHPGEIVHYTSSRKTR